MRICYLISFLKAIVMRGGFSKVKETFDALFYCPRDVSCVFAQPVCFKQPLTMTRTNLVNFMEALTFIIGVFFGL